MTGEWKPSTASRVALYARVSSDRQAQERTIDSQVSVLRERIEADGAVVDPALCFSDDGISGSILVRPALERLRDQVAAGAIDAVYVLSPDRLARRYAHQMVLIEELEACGVRVVFVNRPLGATAEDQLLLQVQGVVAEYERAKILERTRRGRIHAARRGQLSVLSQAPYGYRYVDKRTGGGMAAYEVVAEEADVVRQIFTWVAHDGLSLAEVCRRLEKRGVRPRRRSQKGWDRTTLWGMLKNPAYQGQAVYGKFRLGERRPRLRPGRGQPEIPKEPRSKYRQPASEQITIPVPALVDADLFAAVQERLEENRRRLRQLKRGARYLLQGLAVCGCCGYAICGVGHIRRQKSYAYYRCSGTNGGRVAGLLCHNPSQHVEDLDAAVWNDVCALLSEPERLRQEFERRQQRPESECAAESERLGRAMAKVKQGISRLIDAYADNLVERQEFEPRIRRLKERLGQLDNELKRLKQQVEQDHELRLVFSRLDDFADQIKAGLSSADWAKRREILRTLIKRVEVEKTTIRIVYKVPHSPFANAPHGGRLSHCWGRVPMKSGETLAPTRATIDAITRCRRSECFPREGVSLGKHSLRGKPGTPADRQGCLS